MNATLETQLGVLDEESPRERATRRVALLMLLLLTVVLSTSCRFKKIMGFSKSEYGQICAQQVDCTMQPNEGVVLTPRQECEISLLAQRCTKNDRCLISCWNNGGSNVGGGCWHSCYDLYVRVDDIVTSCAWSAPPTWDECKRYAPCVPPECSEFSYFHSTMGGYSVLLPTEWRLREERGEDYHGWFAPEPGSRSALPSFEVRRFHNYRHSLDLAARKLEQAAEEYAHRIAENLAGSDANNVYEISHGGPGEPFHYRIVAGGACPVQHLAILATGMDWLVASWVFACPLDDEHEVESDAYAMIGSLSVQQSW